MKHNLGDKERINHILEAISNLEKFIENVDLESFINNAEKIAAVERMFEIIGEATNHISEEVLYKKDNSTPWRKIIAVRNIIEHEYFRIDYDILYDIAKKDIIPLKEDIQTILKDLDK